MKDTYDNAEKMARKGGKMVIYESQILGLTLYIILTMLLKQMINWLRALFCSTWHTTGSSFLQQVFQVENSTNFTKDYFNIK